MLLTEEKNGVPKTSEGPNLGNLHLGIRRGRIFSNSMHRAKSKIVGQRSATGITSTKESEENPASMIERLEQTIPEPALRLKVHEMQKLCAHDEWQVKLTLLEIS